MGMLVSKQDGSTRFCVDYCCLNAITKLDEFPLPRIDDSLDLLSGMKYFSTLDLATGYWQVNISPDSREKTALVTHEGLYEFSVMPFDLWNAPKVDGGDTAGFGQVQVSMLSIWMIF